MHWFYYTGRFLTKAALFLLARWKVIGKDNIPRHGPFLVVCNHLAIADPPVIGASIGRKMRIMAKKELFLSPFMAYFIRGYGAFPVSRDRVDRDALREAERCLDDGMALLMFPEGKRSPSGGLEAALPGSALIASRTGAVILPVGIAGTEAIKRRWWWLRRPRITVNIGAPFRLTEKRRLSKDELPEATEFMMRHIAALLPTEYRGQYKVESNEDRKVR